MTTKRKREGGEDWVVEKHTKPLPASKWVQNLTRQLGTEHFRHAICISIPERSEYRTIFYTEQWTPRKILEEILHRSLPLVVVMLIRDYSYLVTVERYIVSCEDSTGPVSSWTHYWYQMDGSVRLLRALVPFELSNAKEADLDPGQMFEQRYSSGVIGTGGRGPSTSIGFNPWCELREGTDVRSYRPFLYVSQCIPYIPLPTQQTAIGSVAKAVELRILYSFAAHMPSVALMCDFFGRIAAGVFQRSTGLLLRGIYALILESEGDFHLEEEGFFEWKRLVDYCGWTDETLYNFGFERCVEDVNFGILSDEGSRLLINLALFGNIDVLNRTDNDPCYFNELTLPLPHECIPF